jgi:hypothetical protein
MNYITSQFMIIKECIEIVKIVLEKIKYIVLISVIKRL